MFVSLLSTKLTGAEISVHEAVIACDRVIINDKVIRTDLDRSDDFYRNEKNIRSASNA